MVFIVMQLPKNLPGLKLKTDVRSWKKHPVR